MSTPIQVLDEGGTIDATGLFEEPIDDVLPFVSELMERESSAHPAASNLIRSVCLDVLCFESSPQWRKRAFDLLAVIRPR